MVELESTFFLDKGVPQSKLISISVVMLLPNSKSAIIATANIDLIQNFGDEFSTSEIVGTVRFRSNGVSLEC